VTKTFKDLLA